MLDPKCGNCPYWLGAPGNSVAPCIRFPPVLDPGQTADPNRDGERDRYYRTGKPVTDYEEICGEHPDFLKWVAELGKDKMLEGNKDV